MANSAEPLSYATPGDELLIPEAEAMITANRPLGELRPLLRKPKKLLAYFAAAKRRQFNRHTAGNACAICDSDQYVGLATIAWNVVLKPRTFTLTLSEDGAKQSFETIHPMCDACHTRWLTRLQYLRLAQHALPWIIWGGLGVTFLTLFALNRAGYRPLGNHYVRVIWPWFLFWGFLGGIINWRVRAATPVAIKLLMPRKSVHCDGPQPDLEPFDDVRPDPAVA